MMKKLILATAVLSTAAFTPAHAADVGVSLNFSQPGVYGRVDIGRFPQPEVIVQQPVVIAYPGRVRPAPVYMWVPPAHRVNWRRYCSQYGACGTPVYFVRDQWYDQHVRHGPRGPHGDRDRDGIPNRYDHRDDRGGRGDRDHDGIPNRHDRHDDRGPRR